MKIKLAMLEKDQSYLNRIVTVFSTKYADKFEIYSFTDLEIAIKALDEARIDVFVASDAFEINVDAIPKRCGFAYFVDSSDVDAINDQRAICKFQKAELIYKQILSIYSENAGNISGLKIHDDSTKLFAFSSPCGGVGTSTVAAACARYFAEHGKKTLYLNIEKFGSADVFFTAEGQFDMSDVIYALKSRKANLTLKLESCAKKDSSGVFFYSESKLALDMLELKAEDLLRLVSELKVIGELDVIVLDMDFALDKESIKLYKMAHELIMVSDGSKAANTKVARAYNALDIIEQEAESTLMNRLSLIYNKFSNKTSQPINGVEIKNLGGAPRYEHATTQDVLKQLSQISMFERL